MAAFVTIADFKVRDRQFIQALKKQQQESARQTRQLRAMSGQLAPRRAALAADRRWLGGAGFGRPAD